jgi:glycosyltransferase involved in cell wall biosynthesis
MDLIPILLKPAIPIIVRKLLSIIMPSYNQGEYIAEALESVLMQKPKDVELLVIDGGSTDDSARKIESFAKHLDYWVSEPDRGQSHALNKGFGRASGQYLCWLNSDDLLIPGSVRAFREHVRNYPGKEWIAAGSIWIDADGRVLRCTRNPGWSSYAAKVGCMSVSAPSSFFSKRLLLGSGGVDEDYHYMMDTELWYRFASRGITYHLLDFYVWALRLHPAAKVSGGDFDPNAPSIARRTEERCRLCAQYQLPTQLTTAERGVVAATRLKRLAKLRSGISTWQWKGQALADVRERLNGLP